jgi:DNA topoisomerase-2
MSNCEDIEHISTYNNTIRSIPSIVDGFKPTSRKVLYACFKKNQNTEIKVNQLSSYVSENTNFLHCEKSMTEAIIDMNQKFPGSNNINLLKPSGNFGSRYAGGDDHSCSRYIYIQN